MVKASRKRSSGEGTVCTRKVNGKEYWVAQVTVGYDDEGKRIRKSFSCKTENEAVQLKNNYLSKLQNGETVFPDKTLFKAWVKEFLDNYKRIQVRQSTFDKYTMLAKNHIYDEPLATKQIQKITTKDIQNLITLKSEKYASKTVREIHLVISMAFDQAVKEELVFKNPAKNVSLPRIVEKQVEPLTDEEILHLLTVTKNHQRLNRMYMPILLALTSGCRRGELLALQKKNVSIDANTIAITQSYVKTAIGNIIQEPKTKASIRKISIPANIMKELQAYLNDNPSPEYVFTQLKDDTKPISPRHFSTMFETLCTEAKLKTKRFHDLRHSYASQLLALNVHMKVVQAQGGWSDIRTCMNRYSHLTGGLQAEAANKLNEKFKNIIQA